MDDRTKQCIEIICWRGSVVSHPPQEQKIIGSYPAKVKGYWPLKYFLKCYVCTMYIHKHFKKYCTYLCIYANLTQRLTRFTRMMRSKVKRSNRRQISQVTTSGNPFVEKLWTRIKFLTERLCQKEYMYLKCYIFPEIELI
jgi:hypothetical protein